MKKKLTPARVFALKGFTIKIEAGKVFVSPTGRNTWSGPYKSLHHATVAIARSCRASSRSAANDCSTPRRSCMAEQLAFSRLLADGDELRRCALVRDRQQLAEWFATFEWDTCAALAAAAGDYGVSHI